MWNSRSAKAERCRMNQYDLSVGRVRTWINMISECALGSI
jgi:hypothetical protein